MERVVNKISEVRNILFETNCYLELAQGYCSILCERFDEADNLLLVFNILLVKEKEINKILDEIEYETFVRKSILY